MTTIRSAALLAAGLGLRMRPLTETTPKPLLTLGGHALLDLALDRLAEHGVTRVVVNAHWQAGQIEQHLSARKRPPETLVRREATLLDTGGAVAAALQAGFFDAAPFFIVNGDSVWLDGPRPTLGRMAAALTGDIDGVILLHRTFLVHADTGFGDFYVDKLGYPRRRQEREIAPYVYAGLTLARPSLFDNAPSGAFSMNVIWDRALQSGRLFAVVHDGLWFHLSQPGDLNEAEQALQAQFTGITT
jgi:MurNAc alpha-1-phosphate uridylyltransferase